MEAGFVLFKLSNTGDWIKCWFDERDRADHCRLTDDKGKLEFEDVFLSYEGQPPLPQSALVFDTRRTGRTWAGTYEKGTRFPIVYLTNGEILLPKTEYEKSRRTVDWLTGKRDGP